MQYERAISSFEFGNRMIVINREDRSCVGIRKEAFCEKDLDDPTVS